MIKWFKYILGIFLVMMIASYIWAVNKPTITIWKNTYILQIEDTKDISLDEFMKYYNSGELMQVKISNDKDIVWYQKIAFDTGDKQAVVKSGNLTDINNLYQKYNLILPWNTKLSIAAVNKYITQKPLGSTINDLGIYPVNPKTQLVVDNNADSLLNSFVANILPLIFMLGAALLLFKFIWPKWWMGWLPFSFKVWKDNKDTNNKTTFDDVAGMEEVKWDLVEIVDFLKNPEKYNKVWAKIPKGVLLHWAPGSGKTLLARAVAGEAGVPFYAASGSEFMEMLVGMWAAKVRELFGKAKLNAPSIIFIDEIDAIGRRRWSGSSGWHQEQEQTLNQILTEMDGFEQWQTVIVIAATNRPDTLDPALMRSGRFDRKIYVSNPQLEERVDIFKYHLSDKKVAEDVSLDSLARRTSWFVWADIANMVNEAALKVAKDDREEVTNADLEYGLEKMLMWPEKKIKTLQESERQTVIYHELGHAVIWYILPNCDPVEKISIVSRGRALWVTWMMPTEDRYLKSKSKYIDDITSLLWWRAAEEIFFWVDNITTGASNDFEKVTAYIYDMLTKYWMDEELWTIQYNSNEYSDYKLYSEKTAEKIDERVRAYISGIYTDAKRIILENKDLMKLLAMVLDKREYITKEEFEEMMANKDDLIKVQEIVNKIIK